MVFGATRQVDSRSFVPEQVLGSLFNGPTPQEKQQGYTSMFSSVTGGILRKVKIEGDTTYVDLSDFRKLIPNASSSCSSQDFFAQVSQTLKNNVSGVQNVTYAINGDPRIFYEFMQIGCNAQNNNCDPTPFK